MTYVLNIGLIFLIVFIWNGVWYYGMTYFINILGKLSYDIIKGLDRVWVLFKMDFNYCDTGMALDIKLGYYYMVMLYHYFDDGLYGKVLRYSSDILIIFRIIMSIFVYVCEILYCFLMMISMEAIIDIIERWMGISAYVTMEI